MSSLFFFFRCYKASTLLEILLKYYSPYTHTQLNEHFNNNVVVFQHMLFFVMYIRFFVRFSSLQQWFSVCSFNVLFNLYWVNIYLWKNDGKRIWMEDNGVVKCLTNPFYFLQKGFFLYHKWKSEVKGEETGILVEKWIWNRIYCKN